MVGIGTARQVRGVVAVGGVAEEDAILVEARGEDAESALEIVLHADGDRRNVPQVPELVAKGCAVASAAGEAAGLVREGVVRLVGERAEGLIRDVNAVG